MGPRRPRSYTVHLNLKAPSQTNMETLSHNHNLAMQKYMLLQEQHDELSSSLHQIRSRQSSMSGSSIASPSPSPTRYVEPPTSVSPTKQHTRSAGRRHSRGQAYCSGWENSQRGTDLDTILDEDTLYAMYAEEQRLCDINESIKRQLTELLNCNAIRNDSAMRLWAQARLMETEKELRSGRRRKSSPVMD